MTRVGQSLEIMFVLGINVTKVKAEVVRKRVRLPNIVHVTVQTEMLVGVTKTKSSVRTQAQLV